jgi:hypothetical protein
MNYITIRSVQVALNPYLCWRRYSRLQSILLRAVDRARHCEGLKARPRPCEISGVTGPCLGSRPDPKPTAQRNLVSRQALAIQSHCAARLLIEIQDRANGYHHRLRAFGSNVFARDTAERSFILL